MLNKSCHSASNVNQLIMSITKNIIFSCGSTTCLHNRFYHSELITDTSRVLAGRQCVSTSLSVGADLMNIIRNQTPFPEAMLEGTCVIQDDFSVSLLLNTHVTVRYNNELASKPDRIVHTSIPCNSPSAWRPLT